MKVLVGWGIALLALALALPLARPALASRSAVVEADVAELREGPGSTYKVIDRLVKGTPVAASNQAIEGYFKVRTSSGVIGFVPIDAVVVQMAPIGDVPPPPAPGDIPKAAAADDGGFRKRDGKKFVRLKALGGYDFFSVGDVNALLSASVLQFGFNTGAEIDYLFTPDLAMVVRIERVFKTAFAHDTKTATNFQMDLSSIPVMVGLELTLTSDTKYSTHFTVMGGLALLTDLSALDLNATTNNLTDLSSTTFTGVAKFDLTYSFNKTWSAFGELGYRYLKTAQLTPSTTGTGSSIFATPTNSSLYVPISLDLSGPFVGVGLGYAF